MFASSVTPSLIIVGVSLLRKRKKQKKILRRSMAYNFNEVTIVGVGRGFPR